MPDEGNLTIDFDHFTFLDFELSLNPGRWIRKRPTCIALVFPHDDPHHYLQTLLKSDICLVWSVCTVSFRTQTVRVVSLILNGMLAQRGQSWGIIHPGSPISVPVRFDSDVYIPRRRAHPEKVMVGLIDSFAQDPPSAIFKE